MALALVGAIATPLALLLWLCAATSFPVAFVAMVLAVLIVLSTGFAMLRALGLPNSSLAAWVLGVFAISLALYALTLWLEVRVLYGAALLALGAGALGWRQRWWRDWSDGRELVGVALCGVVTLLWCHHSAAAPAILSRTGVLPVWIDYFIHGGMISSFGDPLAQGAQSIELAGMPRPFYHYASYLIAAAFAQPLDLPGLPLATSLWLPLGFFTMCAGAHVFGHGLAGPTGGIAAAAALALIPDAADYGLRNAFFGFDWHVLTHPGAAYGVGIALVSFALLARWRDERRPRLLAASLALAAGLLLFRAHIFLLVAPCVLAGAVVARADFRRWWFVYISAALVVLIALSMLSQETRAVQPFLVAVHDQPGIAYAGWYDSLLRQYGSPIAVPLGVLLVFPAFLGVFTFLYPIALWLRRRKALDVVPLLLVGAYAALMVLAPLPANGDATELTQRPFVLVYAVLAIWTAAVLAERMPFRWLVAMSGATVVALWPLSGAWGEGPRFSWGWNYYAHALKPGLARAAFFLRREGKPGDEFAVAGLKRGWLPFERPGWVPTDAAAELAALSGMPAYIARPYLQMAAGGERERVAQDRFAALAALEREPQAPAALARLASLGIRWYVVSGPSGPRWDPERRLAAFVDGSVAVYRTTSL